MFWPCETRTSICRNLATISSGLYRFLAIAVLLDVTDIPQVGPLQWGRITLSSCDCSDLLTGHCSSDRVVAVHRVLLKRLFGVHPTCRCALLLLKRQAARSTSPILQATKRADLPSTAHLGTRELPSGRVAQLLATSDRVDRLTRVAVVPTVSRPAFP